jgi:hypothetical protein
MKKRQQGDDENKKEEMVMTTLKRRATSGSIKHTIKFKSLGALINQDKSKAASIHGDVRRRQQRTTKDGNTSMDLLFT